jgi:diguanylate cyclase (GGDEF)-like protein
VPYARFRVSLHTKILLVVSLCVSMPVLVMGWYLLRQNEEVLGQKVRETLSNQLFRKATQVDDWMVERLREASRWSASFVVFEGLESLSRPGADVQRIRGDFKDYLQSVLGHFRVYESLFIVDLQGQVVAGTREERLGRWGQELIAKAGSPHGPAVSPLFRSEHLERPTLLILHDIQGRGDRTVGYFVERLDLRELESFLGTPSSSAEPAFWLLDDQGRVLMKAGRVLPFPGSEMFPVALPVSKAEPVGQVHLPGVGTAVYGLTRLEGPFAGYVAATVPAAVAYQPLEESRVRLLKVGIPAISILFLLTFLLARGMLRPILLLSEGAQRVSAGDLDVHLPVRGHDELGELTRAFNEMARRIREGRQRLEEARDELTHTNEILKAANLRLEELAITDGLTGLYNRRHFQETLDREMQRAEQEGFSLSLLLLDLDHFKQYNDRWGHTEGDAELRRVAAQVLKTIRSTDTAFRYGGEELAVLLPSCPKGQAVKIAEKIRVAVRTGTQRPGRFGGRTTVSIGVATFPEDGRVARGYVDTADAALYMAKAQGRDRVIAAGQPPGSEIAG